MPCYTSLLVESVHSNNTTLHQRLGVYLGICSVRRYNANGRDNHIITRPALRNNDCINLSNGSSSSLFSSISHGHLLPFPSLLLLSSLFFNIGSCTHTGLRFSGPGTGNCLGQTHHISISMRAIPGSQRSSSGGAFYASRRSLRQFQYQCVRVTSMQILLLNEEEMDIRLWTFLWEWERG